MSAHDDLDQHSVTRRPSSRVWASAMAGLLGLGSACGDAASQEEPDPVRDAAAADAPPPVDAAIDAEVPSKIIRETPGEHTFAELEAMCDQRGGYIEIHASCSGSNTCAGFSYGDWGIDAVLTEHSCAAVSGCNGIGCVVLPADSGKTALEILNETVPDTEGVAQRSCNYCHAEWSEDGGSFDATKFAVKVLPGSGRTLANWLDRSAAQQARIIAFGSHVQLNGTQVANMAAYYQRYSRAEIERVVDYIRTQATPVIKDIKIVDPAGFAPQAALTGRPRARRR